MIASLVVMHARVSQSGDLPPLATPFKIMITGDSITNGNGITNGSGYSGPYSGEHGQGGFRYVMERLMVADVDVSYEAVGPLANGTLFTIGEVPMRYKNHAGYGGKTISYIQERIAGWMTTYEPDVVLLMIGTNDKTTDPSASTFPTLRAQYVTLVENLLGVDSTCRIIFAKISPFSEPRADAPILNANFIGPYNTEVVESIYEEYKSKSDYGGTTQFFLADNNSILSAAANFDFLVDGVHPNGQGAIKVGMEYYERLTEALGTGIARTEIVNVNEGRGSDAFIDAANPNTAYGTNPDIGGSNVSSTLRVRGSNEHGGRLKTYLRFDLTSKIDDYDSATLGLLYHGNSHSSGNDTAHEATIQVYGLPDGSDDWAENGITWNNAPYNDTGGNGLTAGAVYLGSIAIPAGHGVGEPFTLNTPELLEFITTGTGPDNLVSLALVAEADIAEDVHFSQKEWQTNDYLSPFIIMKKHSSGPAPVIGDFNGDGQVTAADAVIALKVLNGQLVNLPDDIATVSGDGTITMEDAIWPLQ